MSTVVVGRFIAVVGCKAERVFQLEEELECISKVSERMNGRMESEEKE